MKLGIVSEGTSGSSTTRSSSCATRPGIDYQEMADRLEDSPSHIAAGSEAHQAGAIESQEGAWLPA